MKLSRAQWHTLVVSGDQYKLKAILSCILSYLPQEELIHSKFKVNFMKNKGLILNIFEKEIKNNKKTIIFKFSSECLALIKLSL